MVCGMTGTVLFGRATPDATPDPVRVSLVATAEDVRPEHLGRGPVTQAPVWGSTETGTELAQLLPRERVRVGVAADPAAQTLIGVLDRAFPPGRPRFATPDLHADLGLQMRPVDELRAAVEGDEFARMQGQGGPEPRRSAPRDERKEGGRRRTEDKATVAPIYPTLLVAARAGLTLFFNAAGCGTTSASGAFLPHCIVAIGLSPPGPYSL